MSDDPKRYDMRVVGNGYPEAFESDGGIWVDYNDHARIVAALLAERDALREALEGIMKLADIDGALSGRIRHYFDAGSPLALRARAALAQTAVPRG